MAGQASLAGATIALDAMTGRATQTARTMYLALLTVAPVEGETPATMTEVSTAGYARQSVAWTAPSGDPRTTSNSGTITFGPFSADPPNVPYCALVSSSSGTSGELVMYWTLDTAKNADINESIQAAIGALTMSQT